MRDDEEWHRVSEILVSSSCFLIRGEVSDASLSIFAGRDASLVAFLRFSEFV